MFLFSKILTAICAIENTELYSSTSTPPEGIYNYPNTTYENLPTNVQTAIRNRAGQLTSISSYYRTIITTDIVSTSNYSLVKNWLFKVDVKSVYYGPGQHRDIDWRGPMQTADVVGEYDWENGPIIQAYGPANLMMRSKYQLDQKSYSFFTTNHEVEFDVSNQQQAIADFKNSSYYTAFVNSFTNGSLYFDDVYSIHYIGNSYSDYKIYYGSCNRYSFTTTADEFDLTDMYAAIRQFINSSYYATFISACTTQNSVLWNIYRLEKTSSTDYSVVFSLRDATWNPRIESYKDNPVVEVVDDSELRMYGGARIKAETVYGETTFTFSVSSDASNEQSVSFTLAELAALKNMLINPPQSFIPLTQAQYDLLDPPDPDTLYVITDGATADMLPDASVEEF